MVVMMMMMIMIIMNLASVIIRKMSAMNSDFHNDYKSYINCDYEGDSDNSDDDDDHDDDDDQYTGLLPRQDI